MGVVTLLVEAMPKLLFSLLISIALLACNGSALPMPEIGPHVQEAPVIVPYPPPPARVEIIGERPNKQAVWIDGEWTWARRRWTWRRGRWELPPKGSYWAKAVTQRLKDGTLVHYAGRWRARDAKPKPSPPEG